jgi:hypothetical protein
MMNDDDFDDDDRTILRRAVTVTDPGDTYPDDAPTWPNHGPLTTKTSRAEEDETTARLKLLIANLLTA